MWFLNCFQPAKGSSPATSPSGLSPTAWPTTGYSAVSAVAGQRADCQWDLPGRCIRRSSWATWSLKFYASPKKTDTSRALNRTLKYRLEVKFRAPKNCVLVPKCPKSIGKYPKCCITCPVNQGTIFPHRSFMLVLPIALGELAPPWRLGGKRSVSNQTGIGKCPMTWGYWTSPYSSHYRPYT